MSFWVRTKFYSIRFWESLAVGSIPILLSDSLELPNHNLWKDTIIELKENELDWSYYWLDNMQTLCRPCHREKTNKDIKKKNGVIK